MMKSRSKLFKPAAAALLLFGFSQAQAQEVPDLAAYRAKYPGHHVVKIKDEKLVRITMEKGVPKVSTTETSDYLVLDKMGTISVINGEVEFSVFEKIEAIEAYSLVPGGKSAKKVKATDFQTKSATESKVFHDGTMVTTFLFNGITEGSVRHQAVTSVSTQNHFPFGFSFFDGIPGENASFVIEADTAVHLLIKPFHTDGFKLDYSEEVVKGKRIIRYSAPSELMLKNEVAAVTARYYAPHVLGQIAYYTTKTGRVNLTGSVAQLHDIYTKSVTDVVNETPAEELRQIADSLTRGKETEFEKVKAVYYWVQDHIKYIAFEEGMGGFVPRQPSAVLTKRFGDCKDMASLIYAMLKSVNIPSYITWVGSRELPYKYSEFPSTFCDNHMITTYKHEGKNYFLDATNSFQSIHFPTAFIQGKEALIHLSDTDFEIAEIPVLESAASKHIDSSFVWVENSSIVGKAVVSNNGYYTGFIGSMARNVPRKEMNKFYSNIYQRGNNSFSVTNATLENENDREGTLVSAFDWKVTNYTTAYDEKLYISMVLQKNFCAFDAFEKERIAPLEIDEEYDDTYYVELEIPQNYSVVHVPADASYSSDYLDFSIVYTKKPGKLCMTLHYAGKYLVMPAAAFPAYNEFIKIKNAALAETVVLTKIKK